MGPRTLAALAALGLAAACSPAPKAGTAAGAGDAAGVARAVAALAPFRAAPAFKPGGEPFDARACATGKSMLSIPNSSANPFLRGVITREQRVGALLGLKVSEWQNQGQPSQWVQGVDNAVQTHVSIVNLIAGVDPKTVEPQIKAARAAGVKVMTSHFYDLSQPASPYLAASLPISFAGAGRILADWATVRRQGKANILLVVSQEVPPTAPLVKGLQDELKANCSQCRIVQTVNVGVSEWATKIQPAVQAALLANPAIDTVIPIYDSMSQFVVPAVALAGRKGQAIIATFNGTPFVLDSVSRGDVDMDIGESLDWIAYATVDGYLRAACGLKVPAELGVPFYIFDKSNVAEAGTPASYDKGYGDAYAAGFRQLWKLPGGAGAPS